MPELPEVEILSRFLHKALRGRQIVDLAVGRDKSLLPTTPRAFRHAVLHRRFLRVRRRGKFMVFELEPGAGHPNAGFLAHLGMAGRAYLQPLGAKPPRHLVVSLQLERSRLVFEDRRYFGRVTLDMSALEKLGPEPLSADFTASGLRQGLGRSRQAIKTRLLAQDVVCGLGNIYVCEALFRSRIHPAIRCHRLTRSRMERLVRAVKDVLAEAIRLGGTMALDWAGQQGRNRFFYYGTAGEASATAREPFRVYGREGEPCFRCEGKIHRMVQGARSTFYCPSCQRHPNE